MRRTNSIEIKVNGPSKGLQTRLPPDLQDDGKSQYLTVAENVRAERGELKAAPGYERVHVPAEQLDGEVNLIHQPNLTSSDAEIQNQPVVGTEGSLYTMAKRARNLVCPADCSLRFAALADSGRVDGAAADVAKLIRGWEPDVIVNAGDLVYPDGGTAQFDDRYETQVAKHYYWAIGGYAGQYGTGPEVNKYLPALGNHDYTDGPLSRYLAFFNLPNNERWYTVKRGPVQFFFIDSYGYGPSAAGPGGNTIAGTGAGAGVGSADLSSTGPQGQWLQAQLAASDCPWRIVVWHHPPQTSENTYYPGYAVLDWPLGQWGADVLITGHAHVYERIQRNDGVLHLTVGTGGHSLRSFVGTPVTGSQFRYSANYGAMLFDVGSTALTAKFYNRAGTLIDTVTKTTARSLSVCYTGGLSKQATGIDVKPPIVYLPKNLPFPLQAVAKYSDGTSVDITSAASWTSSATNIATVDAAGNVTGFAIGSSTVTATYQGFTDTCAVTVLADCVDQKHDIALILDRSGSMTFPTPPNANRIERLKVASKLFLDSLYDGDEVTTISFATDVKVHHGLTSDYSQASEAIDSLVGHGNTAISGAVEAAITELEGNGREGVKKLLILFTDGVANIAPGCDPGGFDPNCAMAYATSMFDAAKSRDIVCIVVALDIAIYGGGYEGIISNWATCPQLYYSVTTADGLGPVFVVLRNNVCVGPCSSGSGIGLGLLE